MNTKYLLVGLLIVVCSTFSYGQEEVPFIEKGNELYKAKKYTEAYKSYEESLGKKYDSFEGVFNLGNSLYQQKKYKEAVEKFELVTKQSQVEKTKVAEAYHNIGNAFSNQQDYKKAVDNYKQALRNNPSDEETRYNLAYAQQKLKEQQEQDGQDDKDEEKIIPSEYAKRMKRKADELRANGGFKEAFSVMQEAMAKDETTKAFKDFIGRLQKVSKI